MINIKTKGYKKKSQIEINIFPNPVSDHCVIKYKLIQPVNVSINYIVAWARIFLICKMEG